VQGGVGVRPSRLVPTCVSGPHAVGAAQSLRGKGLGSPHLSQTSRRSDTPPMQGGVGVRPSGLVHTCVSGPQTVESAQSLMGGGYGEDEEGEL
jgi:hypothetical protein